MSSRPSSQATAGEDNTTTLRSSTAKRPVTKPVAPRLSGPSTATKPTSTSAARTSTTTSSSLSKPPTRPGTIASTVRRPPSSAATAATSTHRSRPSTTSVDASGDEAKRGGIAAKPKRMSLASTSTADRSSTLASRATAATPTSRRVLSSTTTGTARPSVKSPTTTTKSPLTSTSRASSTPTSRVKTTTTPTARTVTTLADRKRLSTIPASPVVNKAVKNESDGEEDGAASDHDKSLAEDTDAGEMEDGTAQQIETASLREELEESRSQVERLQAHLAEMSARMEYFGQSAQEEGEKVQDATETIRAEHEAKIARMMALHKDQMQELEETYKNKMDEATEEFESRYDALQEQIENDDPDRDTEVEALRSELYEVRRSVDEAVNSKMTNVLEEYGKMVRDMKADHKTKIAELQRELTEARSSSTDVTSLSREKEAHLETQASLLTVKKELNAMQLSQEENAARLRSIIRELRGQLAMAHESKEDAARDAESSAAQARIAHEEQLETLQTKLKSAEKEIQANVDISEQHYSEAMQKLQDELEVSQKQLSQIMFDRDSSMNETESQLQSAKEAAENARVSHEQELEALQGQLDAATKASKESDGEHREQMTSLQSQLASYETEIANLKSAQDAQESRIRAELETTNIAAVEALRKTHADQVSELEVQSKTTARDLESLRNSSESVAEEARAKATASHKAALDEQANSYKTVVTELEGKLSDVTRQVDEIKQSHESELTGLKDSHTQDKTRALAALTSEHEQKVSQLESQYQSSGTDLEALKAAHSEEIQKMGSKVNAMTGELDGARFQVQSLKSILQGMEQEVQQKDTEHQEELEKKDQEFSEAVTRLSAQAVRIAELDTAHKQAVEQAKAAVEAETQASLEALKQEHDEAFDTMRRQLAEQHSSTLLTLRSEHTSAIDLLAKEVDIRDQNIDDLRTEHARALEELQVSSQRGNTSALENLKKDHDDALGNLRTSLQAAHEAYIQEIEDKHASKIADNSKKFNESAVRTKAEHDEIVATLHADLDQTREKLRDSSETDTLKAQLSASQQAFGKLQEEQATTTSSMSQEHANEISKLRAEIKTLQAQADRPVDMTELNDARSGIAASNAKIAELTAAHADAIGARDTQHATAVRALQNELAEAQTVASSAQQNTSKMEEVKTLLNDARRTVSELSEQYAMAAMDAETQRVAAETAKKELTELKKSLSEASIVPQASDATKTPSKTANGNTKPSPKPGLQASKWAAPETELTPATTDNISQQVEGENPGLGLRGGATTSTGGGNGSGNARPKRNVAGQMAGIQEHIRQLTEMNDEFLDDHQKWARSLSRVDDDGTVTVADLHDEETVEGNGTA